MKLNRGTIGLILISLIIIVGAVLLNNSNVIAPAAETLTPTIESAGPLFPGIDQNAVVQYTARDNNTGAFTRVTKDTASLWSVDATNGTDREVDQVTAVGTMGVLASLAATQSFSADDLASFGLDTPDQTLTLSLADGTVYTLYVGNPNPNSTRYYVAVAQANGVAPTPRPAGAALDVMPEMTLVSEMTLEVMPESMLESTAEMPSETTLASEMTPEAMPEIVPAAEVTLVPEATLEPVILSGTQTIYLVPNNLVNNLINLIASPPYVAAPTPLPPGTATPNPYSEVQQTATSQALFDMLVQTATASAINQAATASAEATDFVSAPISTPASAESTPLATPAS